MYTVTVTIENSAGHHVQVVQEAVSQEHLEYLLAVMPLAYSLPLNKELRLLATQQAIAEEHGHPGELCRYLGNDMWDCGHVDNLPQDPEGSEGVAA